MNNQTTKSKKRSTASISRKLNAALMRRKFAKNILTDILVAVIVVIVWCLSVEAAHGGVLTNVDDRQFAVTEYHTLEARIEQPIYAIFDFFNYIRYNRNCFFCSKSTINKIILHVNNN